jgi:hypothetical protein
VSAPAPIVVRGIFRSGTNLAKHLLLQAGLGPVLFHAGWHKHLPGPPPLDAGSAAERLLCCKQPLAAMESLFRYARRVEFAHFECGREWKTFLREPFAVSIRGVPDLPAFRFETPMEYWNAFHREETRAAPAAAIWRFEDQLRTPQALVDALAARLSRPAGPVHLPVGTLERSGDDDQAVRERDLPFKHARHLERGYLASYDDDDLLWVDARLDREVMATLGYQAGGAFA